MTAPELTATRVANSIIRIAVDNGVAAVDMRRTVLDVCGFGTDVPLNAVGSQIADQISHAVFVGINTLDIITETRRLS
jgi:hypothetical protein